MPSSMRLQRAHLRRIEITLLKPLRPVNCTDAMCVLTKATFVPGVNAALARLQGGWQDLEADDGP